MVPKIRFLNPRVRRARLRTLLKPGCAPAARAECVRLPRARGGVRPTPPHSPSPLSPLSFLVPPRAMSPRRRCKQAPSAHASRVGGRAASPLLPTARVCASCPTHPDHRNAGGRAAPPRLSLSSPSSPLLASPPQPLACVLRAPRPPRPAPPPWASACAMHARDAQRRPRAAAGSTPAARTPSTHHTRHLHTTPRSNRRRRARSCIHTPPACALAPSPSPSPSPSRPLPRGGCTPHNARAARSYYRREPEPEPEPEPPEHPYE